jgi:hypothetical protein
MNRVLRQKSKDGAWPPRRMEMKPTAARLTPVTVGNTLGTPSPPTRHNASRS